MEMLGNRRLGVTQQQAWEALNDPETLKKCIPGCDKFELTGDNTYSVALALKIGPVSAKFSGKVMLSDIVAPDGYKLTFEGQGGVAGFAKGSSSVSLKPLAAVDAAASDGRRGTGRRLRTRLHRAGAGRRQDRPAGPAPDRRRRQVHRRRFLQALRRRDAAPLRPAARRGRERGKRREDAPAEKAGMMSGLMKKIGLGKKDDSAAPGTPGDAA
jgi:carbon monoxide dehydrogenase subunit G